MRRHGRREGAQAAAAVEISLNRLGLLEFLHEHAHDFGVRSWQAALAGMFIGLESQFLDICKKIVPALHKYYGHKPGAREIRFFEEHIHADEVHGSKGFAIVEKYADTAELQALALKTVEEATLRRWRYMNSLYWYALHGKEDDTPTLQT